MPQLRIDAGNDSHRPTVREHLQSLIGAIEAGGMTASDIAGLMADWQVDLLYTDGADWNAANIVVGSLVRELGRATDGEYTRAIHEPTERQDSWHQSLGRGFIDTISLNLLDEIEALWIDMTSDLSYSEALAATRHNMALLEAANPEWYYGGQLAGMVGQTLMGNWAAARLASPATLLGRMGGNQATSAMASASVSVPEMLFRTSVCAVGKASNTC